MDSGNVNINILESIVSFYIKSANAKVFDKDSFCMLKEAVILLLLVKYSLKF